MVGGNDTANGGLGVDTLSGGDGNDAITSRESPATQDNVTCGTGTDIVTADFLDTANADCETVNRA